MANIADVQEKPNYFIRLSENDKTWLQQKYPNLKVSSRNISGELCFQREYDGVAILDCFNVEIILEHNKLSMLPKVRCLDERMINIVKLLNLTQKDQLHINPDDSFCLTVYPKEKSLFVDGVFNIQTFFEKLLEPYLYWVSFYERYRRPPWGEYSHGMLGLLEYIGETDIDFRGIYKILKEQNKPLRKMLSIYRQSYCFCDDKSKSKSKRKIRNCHNGAWQGIKKIRKLLCERVHKS